VSFVKSFLIFWFYSIKYYIMSINCTCRKLASMHIVLANETAAQVTRHAFYQQYCKMTEKFE